MKNLMIGILSFFVLSIAYVVSGLDIFGYCYRNAPDYTACYPVEYAEFAVSYPARFVSMHTPIKFTWGDDIAGTGVGSVGSTTNGGFKLGSKVIIQTWKKFIPI
jgi:hypothetical protein